MYTASVRRSVAVDKLNVSSLAPSPTAGRESHGGTVEITLGGLEYTRKKEEKIKTSCYKSSIDYNASVVTRYTDCSYEDETRYSYTRLNVRGDLRGKRTSDTHKS